MEDFEGPSFSLGLDFDFEPGIDEVQKQLPVSDEAPSFSLGLDFDFESGIDDLPKQLPVCEEVPSFSLGLDVDFESGIDDVPKQLPVCEEVPSFSLGLDVDFETNNVEPVCNEAAECSVSVSSKSFEQVGKIQQETLYPDVYIEDPPPVLKSLKRGASSSQSPAVKKKKREPVFVSWNVDDDIKEFSSQEDSPKDKQLAVQNHSIYSSSKVPLHGLRVQTTQSLTKPTSQKDIPSNGSTTRFEDIKFPKLTISPIRKFQLVDSDSDDPSAVDVPPKDVNMVNGSRMKRQYSPSLSVSGYQQKKANNSASTLKNVDLWKDFTPKKSVKVQTPALDEFCEEYFRSVKETNVNKGMKDIYPNFFPLGAMEDQFDKHSGATAIDYMSQFGHKENPSQFQGKANKDPGQSSQRGRRNLKKPNVKEAPANWVSPKGCVNIPKDAGKRRVHANNQSAGHWYSERDGKKVYMSKTGQVLTGRMAYMHYKKESGAGFRKSRARATSKKKPK